MQLQQQKQQQQQQQKRWDFSVRRLWHLLAICCVFTFLVQHYLLVSIFPLNNNNNNNNLNIIVDSYNYYKTSNDGNNNNINKEITSSDTFQTTTTTTTTNTNQNTNNNNRIINTEQQRQNSNSHQNIKLTKQQQQQQPQQPQKQHTTTSNNNNNNNELPPPPIVNNEKYYTNCTIQNKTYYIPNNVPKFIIIGAQKCGTTALYYLLNEHPNLQGSIQKETHFFDWYYPSTSTKDKLLWLQKNHYNNNNNNVSINNNNINNDDFQCAIKDAYSKYFINSSTYYNNNNNQNNQNITSSSSSRSSSSSSSSSSKTYSTYYFEKTPSYLFLSKVPKLIYDTCYPNNIPKIIVILRNPIDRAFSHFQMGIRVHNKYFEEFINDEIKSMNYVGLSNAPTLSTFLNITTTTTNTTNTNTNSTTTNNNNNNNNNNNISNNNNILELELEKLFIPPYNLTKEQLKKLHFKHYRKSFENNYIQRGIYYEQLVHWIEYFPLHTSLKVIKYESFLNNPLQTYYNILQFLNVSLYTPKNITMKYNDGKKYTKQLKIENKTKEYLKYFFKPYNIQLSTLLSSLGNNNDNNDNDNDNDNEWNNLWE